MKKLKLKAQELGANELLTRQQLKNVLGGGSNEPLVQTTGNCSGTCTSGDILGQSANCTTSGSEPGLCGCPTGFYGNSCSSK